MRYRLRFLLAVAGTLLLTGGACQRPDDPTPEVPPPADDAAPPTDPAPEGAGPGDEGLLVDAPGEPEPDGGTGRADYPPAAIGDRIEIEPDEPSAGEAIRIRAGPLTFRNGCEGIEHSFAEPPDEGGRIVVGWKARPVPPDAFCTMALHDMWIDVTLEDLPAGDYTVVVPDVGEKALTVDPASE